MEMKRTHFKMYKAGRKWVFACALVLAMIGGATTTAKADTTVTDNGQPAERADAGSQKPVSDHDPDVIKDKQNLPANSEEKSDSGDHADAGQVERTKNDQQKPGLKDESDGSTTDPDKLTHTTEKEAVNEPKVTQPSGISGIKALSGTLSAAQKESLKNALAAAQAKAAAAKLARSQATDASAISAYANDAVQNGGSVYDDYSNLDNILGVSSMFHIFAYEAELNAHTNGNIAVGNLIGNVNFGTNIIEELLDKDISYIQNFTNIAGSSFVSKGNTRENKVIFGEGITIDVSNPNRPLVNGTYIDHLLASETYQDKNGNTYIDFDAEFAKLKALNESLGGKSSEASYTNSDFDDPNNRVIDVTNMTPNADNQIIINLSPDVLAGNTPLKIVGLSPEETGTTVIINVDTGGQADYHVNSPIKITYSDGSDRDNHETEDFGDNHLLWNFIDRSAADQQYHGNLIFDATFQGSVLAPSADITVNHNLDGNIIGKRVVVNGETHRWDLQDHNDKDENPDPDEYDKPVTPDIEAPLPEIPGTEEPDTEEPDTGTPDENDSEDEEEFEHERPDYGDEDIDDIWDDMIDAEEEDSRSAEEAVLNEIDSAIAWAKAHGDLVLVNELEAMRNRLLADLGELPQTNEANSRAIQVIGLALLTSTLGAVILKRRRQN
ncbi:collagen-binding domain-containing protein [Levilactobacillus huananensis]|uniref:collagen-binding domain-containing protein n=1 Tax=Levilactobacillus huananensis TaxID=2486019 RepID=UPI000F7B28CA|nr:collagen-binding domain-containing protein [Levilactobacillus huananensis]